MDLKLGGNYIPGPHIVTRCVAFDNQGKGFDQNHNTAGVTLYNCTSYNNSRNFAFSETPTTGQNILKNNISLSGPVDIENSAIQEKNSWDGFTISSDDFISLDTDLAKSPRKADSSLPDINLFRLSDSSSMIDAGVDVGLVYNGRAPDLGAFESGVQTYVPIELIALTAKQINYSVELQWLSVTEINNKGFEIEKKSNTKDWSRIGFIPGKGNSSEPVKYNYSDNFITPGTSYYRLKQIDFDGRYVYSNSINIDISQNITKYFLNQNYPNPFNPETTIAFSIGKEETVSLKIYDLIGNQIAELLNQKLPAGIHSVKFSGENLSNGIYFYTLETESFSKTNKMILLK